MICYDKSLTVYIYMWYLRETFWLFKITFITIRLTTIKHFFTVNSFTIIYKLKAKLKSPFTTEHKASGNGLDYSPESSA